ncbi:MAG: translation initiation factor IF-2 [Candidatus Spechtbacterales bacterium]|nr:translation initiation factor IF-2 [Candidatus Spechtbacterales bacterium]
MSEDKNNSNSRPPVVVILGHVDHGKTSILDYIRKAKVAEGESGGITQHIGAYQVEQDDKKITFIDTPGHEAFSAMRSRGANIADIAVLVIAADDGVMPQTKEAISIIKKANVPFIVAINKIDKPEANAQKVKTELLEHEVLLEGYGGQVPNVEMSAKSGQGIDELLDMINLVAELEEFEDKKNKKLKMAVIESSMDEKRGALGTLLVKQGVAKSNTIIAGSTTWARVKAMEDFLGNSIDEAGPSTPVVILGFNEVPQVGEVFVEVDDTQEAEERVEKDKRKYEEEASMVSAEEGQRIVNLVLKADVDGTLEAVHSVLRSLNNDDIKIRVLEESVGDISDSDVRLASGGNALVVGFRVKANRVAQGLAEQQEVPVIVFDTIYELVQGVRESISSMIEPETVEEVIGKVKILGIFRRESSKMIVGGRVIDGMIKKGTTLRVVRDGEELGIGRLRQLKQIDKNIDEAKKGEEIGMQFEGSIKIEEGDILEVIEKKEIRPSL